MREWVGVGDGDLQQRLDDLAEAGFKDLDEIFIRAVARSFRIQASQARSKGSIYRRSSI
ncbi:MULTISPECIES: hypothetical protein [unclassified Chamaesiphon]|uniref:hypothetical protein n=1 Tax=unclassified Chamaesiphon TaxID=2620921 RepID=UPI00286AF073|nr:MULTISPECIES: hypothetical protein [unclassified Chamaesiphon]